MKNAYELTPEQRNRVFRIFLAGLLLAFFVLGFKIMALAGKEVGSESSQWESVILARVVLAKALMAIPVAVLGILGVIQGFLFLDHSGLAPRFLHFGPDDDSAMRAAKVRNAGLAIAALVVGLFTFLSGILK